MDDDEEKITIKDQKSSLEKKLFSNYAKKEEIIEEKSNLDKKNDKQKERVKRNFFHLLHCLSHSVFSSPIYSGGMCVVVQKKRIF